MFVSFCMHYNGVYHEPDCSEYVLSWKVRRTTFFCYFGIRHCPGNDESRNNKKKLYAVLSRIKHIQNSLVRDKPRCSAYKMKRTYRKSRKCPQTVKTFN